MAARSSSRFKSLRRLAVAAACAGAMSAAPAADVPQHVLKDPHYGDTLFHFFQDRYFTSITTLMVSQHFDRVSQHADEAELLRGGMLLSYGLHREAGEIFAQLIDRSATPAVRDRAWFYLAKIRYQRGFTAEAEAAMARIEKNLPPALEEERMLLQANMLLARGEYAAAAEVLKAPAAKAEAGQYARYNLGVALVKGGDAKAGSEMLDALGKAPALTEEFRNLRDKANVALGFTALQNQEPHLARGYLERVRLNGPHSNKALLGFGWAAAEMKDAKLALVPWTELATRDASDSAVLEARIAVPYAYAELGAFGQALDRYNEAVAEFEREGRALDETIAAIRAGKLVQGLAESNPGDEMGWFWNIRELPEMPHGRHLSQVMAQHEFQEAFKNWRDLQFLHRNLQRWQDNLGVFTDMLDNRRKAFTDRLPQVRAKASETGLPQLQQQAGALARELAEVEASADARAFADERERALIERLDGVRATLEQLDPKDPETAATRERYRLAAGAMTWQLAQQYPNRLWEAKKGQKTLEAQLVEAQRRDAALAQAQKDEPVRFDKFGERIAALNPRIAALLPRVVALGNEQQQQVQDIAVAELSRQKERLAVYATQARFALAQLYDRAVATRSADDTPKQ